MKTQKTFSLSGSLMIAASAALLISGCGKFEKNPVQDLNQMRELGKNEINKGPDKPKEVTNTVVVEKPVEVVKEQATVDQNFIVITPDPQMSFVEGQSGSFQVDGRCLVKGVTIKLVAQGLPEGAKFEAAPTDQDKDRYLLTWTPAYNTVAGNAAMKILKINISAQIVSAPSEKDRQTLEGLSHQKEIPLLVLRNQTPPSDLKVENLPAQINEGTLTKFDVTVLAPGIDSSSPQKPRLVITYDNVYMTTGNDYRELDGSRYVIADQSNKDAEYLGSYKWRFHLIYDTQNIGVQPAQGVNGATLATADSTHVRLSLKVYSPLGTSTPEDVQHLQIMLTKPVTAPRFDLSGLGQETLELTPGDKINFKFFVSTVDSKASLKMDVPSIKSLKGAPSLTCAQSAATSRQDCTLIWNVPCDASDADLTQEISMTATAISGGRASESVKQVLKVTRSTKDKAANCTAPAKATPNQAGGK